jgi:Tol biopolymer transport system component
MGTPPRLLLTAGIVLLLVTPLGGIATSTATATTSASISHTLSGRIVFARVGGQYGEETIFVANADGSHQHRLTPLGMSCCARFSRDGKQILYAASGPNGRITTAIVRPDGTGYRTLPLPGTTLNLGPGPWSPDGKRIAFEGWDDHHPGRNGIYVGSSSNGSGLKRVTTVRDIPGDFSPDGRRLAFLQLHPNSQPVGPVWVVNVDGTGLIRLTPPKFFVSFGTIRWSPDGTKILFADAGDQLRGDLWTIHPNGSHLTKVFQDQKGRFAISPTWSPSGKQIMFALDPTNHEDDHAPNGLYVINADGTGLTRVLGGQDFKTEPDWVR